MDKSQTVKVETQKVRMQFHWAAKEIKEKQYTINKFLYY